MPAVLDVDPDVYASAGRVFLDVNDAVCDVVAAAAKSANTGGGMAGVDSSGAAWAGAYDSAAASLLRARSAMVDAVGALGDRLTASGANHDDAEAASVPNGAPAYPGQPGTTRAVGVVVSAPPSADGTPTDPPPGWWLVAHLLAWTWPAGHVDQLVEVGTGWLTASLKLADEADRLSAPIADLAGETSPEVALAVSTCTGLQGTVRMLADQYAVAARACTGYASAIGTAHREVIAELVELIITEAAVEAAGAILSAPTAGMAQVPTQSVAASRASVAAARIGGILARLAEDVLTLQNLMEGVTEQVVSVLTSLQQITEKQELLQAVTQLVDEGIPPVDLQANEDDNPSAHVLDRHVDKDDDYLKNRPKRVSSTFTSLAAATTALSTLLAANRALITDWLASGDRDVDLYGLLPRGAGRCYLRDSGQFVGATRMKATLVRSTNGYFIVTAFPLP